MAIRRRKKASPEIPLTSTADVAFLLLVFFLVAASNSRDSGTPLDLPGTVKTAEEKAAKNLEVLVRPKIVAVGGEVLDAKANLADAIRKKLGNKKSPAERVVLVASEGTVSYQRWSDVIAAIEAGGGIPAPQMEGDTKAAAGGERKTAQADQAAPAAAEGDAP